MTQTSTRFFVAVVCGLAFASLSASSGAKQDAAVDPALKKAVDARIAARQSGDAAAYARYVMDDAYFAGPDGALSSKAERITVIKTAKPAPVPKVSEEKYRMLGESAVHTYRTNGTDAQGQKQSGRYIEVWTKQGGEWKLAAIQFSTIAKP